LDKLQKMTKDLLGKILENWLVECRSPWKNMQNLTKYKFALDEVAKI